jgi:hypothetical protein
MKQKKEYEKPSMQVFELSNQPQILAGSFQGDRNNPFGDPLNPIGW